VTRSAIAPIVSGLRELLATLRVRMAPAGSWPAAARHAFATMSTGTMSIAIEGLAAKRPPISPAP
jgi:hypothetical protein